MTGLGVVFLDFSLPNATSWFYFSLFLSVAIFFKFSRLLSMRNLDVVTLFLLVPGLLILQEVDKRGGLNPPDVHLPFSLQWVGYLWLLCGSGYFLIRCLIDLTLVQRPALSPNLNLGGLAWFGTALFVCLVSVAARPPEGSPQSLGKGTAAIDEAQKKVEDFVNLQSANGKFAGLEAGKWVGRGLSLSCHFLVVTGLFMIGWRHFQDAHAGMAAATFYLLLPYTAFHIGQLHHVWPIALLIWGIYFYRHPMVAGLFLGLAAGSVFFPALLFPLWLSFFWRRGAGRFATTFLLFAGISLVTTGFFLWMEGDLSHSLQSTLSMSDWQPWKEPKTEGFWNSVHWAYRFPVFVGYLALLCLFAFWPSPKNLAHLISLSAGILIGIQFWYADKGGVYVLWYLPLLLLLVFRPNLSDRFPLPIQPETDWLGRSLRFCARLGVRLMRFPEPAIRVR